MALEKQIAMQTGLKSADDIKSIKQNLSIATLDQRSFISAVNSVVQVQSADIKLTNFSYSYNVGTSTMIISGTALNRLSLQLFQKNLANQKLFNSADLPLSDYAKDTNIPFSITLVGAF